MQEDLNEPLFDLQLDHEAGGHFQESSKWAKFLSVIYFIAIGIVLLILLFAATAVTTAFEEYRSGLAGAGGILVAALIVGLALAFYTAFLLFRFATLTKQGIERQDQIIFNKGLQALRNYFMIYGVIAMLALIFSIISGLTNLGK